METTCKDCNRLIDECTCLQDTIDFPKYTSDQHRRAVEEIVRRLESFEGALKLIRQFNICEQDIARYIAARKRNDPRYIMSHDPAYDAHPRQSIDGWLDRNLSTFDQAIEEATELRTLAREAARDREEMLKEAHKASVARYMKQAGMVPHSSLKSYSDWA